jgi:hypothetical protein
MQTSEGNAPNKTDRPVRLPEKTSGPALNDPGVIQAVHTWKSLTDRSYKKQGGERGGIGKNMHGGVSGNSGCTTFATGANEASKTKGFGNGEKK